MPHSLPHGGRDSDRSRLLRWIHAVPLFSSALPSTFVLPSITRHRSGLVTNRHTLLKLSPGRICGIGAWRRTHVLRVQGLRCPSSASVAAPVVVATLDLLSSLLPSIRSRGLPSVTRCLRWSSTAAVAIDLIWPRLSSCLTESLFRGRYQIHLSGQSAHLPFIRRQDMLSWSMAFV